MTNLLLFGFLSLTNGRRSSSANRQRGTSTFHNYYATLIECSNGSDIPAELRVYSPPNDTILPDNTIAYVIARAYCPSAGMALLDAIQLTPFNGDPSLGDEYDDSVPSFPPTIIGIGMVASGPDVLADGQSKSFAVIAHERVRDESKTSTIQCIYDASPRWATVPAPSPNSTISFLGRCSRVRSDGVLGVDLELISFNVGPSPVAVGGGTLPGGSRSSTANTPQTPRSRRRHVNPQLTSPQATRVTANVSPSASSSTSRTANHPSTSSLTADNSSAAALELPLPVDLREMSPLTDAPADEINGNVPDAHAEDSPSQRKGKKRARAA